MVMTVVRCAAKPSDTLTTMKTPIRPTARGKLTYGTCGGCVARVSATPLVFTPEWFLYSDAFRLVVLGEVDDALGVLGVDRVVPTVRVLVSW